LEEISKKETLKTSVARKIKRDLEDAYPTIAAYIEDFFPKKEPMCVYKTKSHMQFLAIDGELAFYSTRDGPFVPTLRFLHKYPNMMKKVQVDRGAIPFVLKGAPIMAVGITSPGGKIFEDLDAGTPVAVYAEGKQHAAAIGVTAMSTAEMKSGEKRGCGVENQHCLGDGLWHNYKVD